MNSIKFTKQVYSTKRTQGNLPLTYQVSDTIKHLKGEIDIAFSHEVLYLLKDLEWHAQEMFNALKEHGIYYAVLGTHADNPIWQELKDDLANQLGMEPQDYTLYQIADAFERQGFTVQARKFKFDDFLLIGHFKEDDQKQGVPMLDTLNYYSEYKVLFRFTR